MCIQAHPEQLSLPITKRNIYCTTMICVLKPNDSTSYFGAAMISLNWSSPVSNLTTKNQVNTGVNNYKDPQYFATTQKQIHSDTEIGDTKNTTSRVQFKVCTRLCQHIPLTPTTSFKNLHLEYYIYFKLKVKLPMQHSVPNQGN